MQRRRGPGNRGRGTGNAMRLVIRGVGSISATTADVTLIVWILVWVVVGTIAFVEIRDLEQLSDTLGTSGVALDTAGSALETIGAVPIVGDGPERLGRQVRATAQEVTHSAAETRDSVRVLSLVVGLSIVFIPTVPALTVYLPWRLARRRDATAVSAAVERHGDDRALEEHLASRALHHVPFARLVEVIGRPWGDLGDDEIRLLANLELTRLGVAHRGDDQRTSGSPS